MKLDYKKTFLIGLGFFTVSVIWSIYNVTVPLYLDDLGLKGVAVGAIMAIDNVFAVILQPVFGALSDRTNTAYGRRMPYLLVGIPMSAAVFFVIPFFSNSLILLMISLILLNLSMSIYRSPAVALMPDFTPPSLRSRANGIINFMGGAGAALMLLLSGMLYDMNEIYPFSAGSLILILCIIVMYNTIKEPGYINPVSEKRSLFQDNEHETVHIEASDMKTDVMGRNLSLTFMLIAIFFWFAGYNAIETFFSTYGKEVLGVQKSTTSYMLAVLAGTFVVFAIPAGLLAGRLGRKKTIMAGLSLLLLVLISLIFVESIEIMYFIMAIGGISWAMININSYPMVVEMTRRSNIGKYTGYYYFFSMLASIISPVLFGYMKDILGVDFLFIYSSLSILAALFFIMPVKHGESDLNTGSAFESIRHME